MHVSTGRTDRGACARAPRWMRVTAVCASGASVLLGAAVYAMVWSGLAFGRERLPVLEPG